MLGSTLGLRGHRRKFTGASARRIFYLNTTGATAVTASTGILDHHVAAGVPAARRDGHGRGCGRRVAAGEIFRCRRVGGRRVEGFSLRPVQYRLLRPQSVRTGVA